MEFTKEQKEKIQNFIDTYKNYYSEPLQKLFLEIYTAEEVQNYDFIMQILSYLFPGKIIKERNVYTMFLKYLLNRFPNIDRKKILEVASGYLPGFSLILKEKIKRNLQLTCMDPKTIPIKMEGIKTKKEQFTQDTDTTNYDILIATCPCDALDDIVASILKRPKEICVQSCPCRKNSFYNLWEFRYYIDALVDKLQVLKDDGYEVYCENTEASTYTMAPAFSVLKREYPKIQYLKK